MSRKSTRYVGWTSYFSAWGFSGEAMDGWSSLAALLQTLPSCQKGCKEEFQMEVSHGTAGKRDHVSFPVCLTL